MFSTEADVDEQRGVWRGKSCSSHAVAVYFTGKTHSKSLNFLFFFFFFWSASVVAAGCSRGREGGGVAWLPEPSSSPDLELDLFLFTLQPRREIFKSAVECVCVCV